MSDEVARVATCSVHEISPMHPDILKSPRGMNRRLRAAAPVFQDPNCGIFFVSRYEEVIQIAKDHKTFSSRMMGPSRAMAGAEDPEVVAVLKSGYENVPTMLTEDPPNQRRYRKFVDGAFSPSSLKSLEPFIENLSTEFIDTFFPTVDCDFLSKFGLPLPLKVIIS